MKDKTRYILLTIIGILILLVIGIQAAYSFLGPGILEGEATGGVSVKTCAQLKFSDVNKDPISLKNSFPMDDLLGLQTTPYEFTITSTCDDSNEFSLYLVSLENTENGLEALDDTNIHYALREDGKEELLANDVIKETLKTDTDFAAEEMEQLQAAVGTPKTIYKIYTGTVTKNEEKNYKLYLWIDETVTDSDTMNKAFTASLAAKVK